MLLSKYFLPTLKEKPHEAETVSHALMIRAGMIKQQASGIYSWLPLGLKVLQNIEQVIRKHMNSVGAIEILMPCIQPADLWVESGRFDSYGKEMLKFLDRHDHMMLFGPTNEEVVTDIFRDKVQSYKDLPKNLYHIQWKFRDEIRPRFGVMRGREFLMKDGYSFDIDKDSAVHTYYEMYSAYLRIFRDLGLFAIPTIAENGPIGGSLSHEFSIIADTGESKIYYDKKFESLSLIDIDDIDMLKSIYAVAEEKHDPNNCPLSENDLRSHRAIEVGHIFYFDTKYSTSMNALVMNKNSQPTPVHMSSYGIGISRLVAAIIEASHDDYGIIWPKNIAPFKVSLINLNIKHDKCNEISKYIYDILVENNIDVLYDDTYDSLGSKFANHNLIGFPYQIIIGTKHVDQNKVELKTRVDNKIDLIDKEIAIKTILTNLSY
ncbi:MAG: proline--tRNA ligase [Rickettsiaceae bacterium]